ncbi:GNAT family N-acetyltransferase [Enemella sp. A6]|uniref:GNAT family N-acetyltransferase n=1 Tax=Enemella sp. A6 TaxID=3440152 RepID=UPI003EBE65C5
MEVIKTRESDLVEQVAELWATATAHRDEVDPTDVNVSESVPLMRSVLKSSERSFLLVGKWSGEVEGESEGTVDRIVSFGAVEPEQGGDDENRGELRYLGVAPQSWGEGWARRLLVALPDAAREENFSEVVLWVYADNIRAIWVYEAMGWGETGLTRPHPKTGRTEAQYRLKLT